MKAKIGFVQLFFFAVAIFFSSVLSAQGSYMEQVNAQKGTFTLLPLPYSYAGLMPYFDPLTMELHHDEHQRAYVDGLNKAVKGTVWANKTMLEMFQEADTLPQEIRDIAGGHWNHSLFWTIMTPDTEKRKMPERLENEVKKQFGSVEKLKQELKTAGLKRFGSGYAWLVKDNDGKLIVGSTANQDNPLMKGMPLQGKPLLLIDVWEHAYYIQYHNLRGDFLESFWNVVNWQQVDEYFGNS